MNRPSVTSVRVCLVGATDDTGNLGVSALMRSVLVGLARRAPDARLTVFDNQRGLRRATTMVDDREYTYERFGMWPSRRVHRPESLWNLRVAARVGGGRNPGARRILEADAVWDISGGDSFGDLYGRARWNFIAQPKRLALGCGRPLHLLPQTYGPFRDHAHRATAAAIVRDAETAWARDADSYAALRELAGADFDPTRHRLGVDVAFGLDAREPQRGPVELRYLLRRPRTAPLVGVNVSGLLYNDAGATRHYGLRAHYPTVIARVVRSLVEDAGADVVLVAHVRGLGAESDDLAIEDLRDGLPADIRQRVTALPRGLDTSEMKWVIGQFDWFCGTRMHSTIAALSSGVPAAAIAYSLKTRGVFATCGLGDRVADARSLTTDHVVADILKSYGERRVSAAVLRQTLPDVRRRADEQMDEIIAHTIRRRVRPASMPRAGV